MLWVCILAILKRTLFETASAGQLVGKIFCFPWGRQSERLAIVLIERKSAACVLPPVHSLFYCLFLASFFLAPALVCTKDETLNRKGTKKIVARQKDRFVKPEKEVDELDTQ